MGPFKPPDNFDFSNPSAWPEWKQRFQRFFSASKLNKEDQEVQVSTLIYVMGQDAEKILTSFDLTPEDAKIYATVLHKFDENFVPQVNVIHE